MKLSTNKHSGITKISDLLFLLFSAAFSLSQSCISNDLLACILFLLCVMIILIIKYIKIDKDE